MYKNLKIKLYPTVKQKQMLDRHFDAYRWAYNLCLEYKLTLWKHHKKNISGYDMQKELFQIRKETEWLSKCKAECVREAAQDVDKSFKKFFKGNGFPKFKSRKSEQSFHAYQSVHSISGKIKFFKNLLSYRSSQSYIQLLETNKIKKITFKRDSCGDYWAACLIELPSIKHLPKSNNSIGIDLGIKDLVITSEGQVFPNNKYLRSQEFKLRKLQRKFVKTKKGGKNREKLRKKVAKVYRKTVRQKEHYYHQITNGLIRDNQTIVMETLSAKNMMKNRKLARSISDASWGLFTSMLEYKCAWYGRKLIKINRWFPSSKTCSSCGNVKETLKLSERTYICDHCNMEMDRDINAAINIKIEGLKIPGLTTEDTDNSSADEVVSNHLI